ncbi:unnamed protein product [Caenorhabditis bovis]|uniref:Uncharacterized protein n=1 Tax=Caenorhabditis bovis TaxID=2654633 RepID=A0A8S1EUJ3_9PELO|nr:unnamed protein product [Caenorhabditis bovis]
MHDLPPFNPLEIKLTSHHDSEEADSVVAMPTTYFNVSPDHILNPKRIDHIGRARLALVIDVGALVAQLTALSLLVCDYLTESNRGRFLWIILPMWTVLSYIIIVYGKRTNAPTLIATIRFLFDAIFLIDMLISVESNQSRRLTIFTFIAFELIRFNLFFMIARLIGKHYDQTRTIITTII